jgi:hypothetical protein
MRKAIILIIIIAAAAVTSFANIKVKTKQSVSGQSYENTTYIKGKRQRAESMGGKMISLTQCDLRRAIQMNPETKTFVVNEFGEISTENGTRTAGTNQPITKGGKIISTITVKDTGERKQMFGFTARHLIITMDTESTPDACTRSKSKMETDGWYIDFDFAFDCDMGSYRAAPQVKNGGCQDKYETKTIGTAKRGFALYEKMTFFDESGKETMSMISEVVELSKATLDAALFEVPSDYRQVQDSAQLYASAAQASTAPSSMDLGGNTGSSDSAMALPNAGSTGSASSVGEKRAGTVRIGLATVKTGAVGEGITAGDLASAVQNTLIAFLKMPNVEIVTLESRLPAAIDSEAAEKQCDFVIHANVSHKKGGGGGFGKMFGGALSSAVSMAGVGGGAGGYIAGQVASQAISSAAMSGQMKSKDEVTLDLKLNRSGGAAAFAKVYKAKARSNGDDIISQVIEQAAINIAENIGK